MESVMSRKVERAERFMFFNSLASIPVMLIGRNTIIDLTNETSVAGTIDDVDGYMNITMVNVVFIDQRLQQRAFDMFHIQARNIRILHIPESMRIGPELKRFFERFSSRPKTKKPNTFKIKRAERQHKATLLELAANNAQPKPQTKTNPDNDPLKHDSSAGPSHRQ